MPAHYRLRHETAYTYSAPVSLARHLLHLEPRDCPWQAVEAFRLHVEPAPSCTREAVDTFGNPITRIALERPHTRLVVASEARLCVLRRPWAQASGEGDDWELVVADLAYGGPGPLEANRYQFESPYIRVKRELYEYARASFVAGRPLLAATACLMERIHREFVYDPQATEVGTSVLEVLSKRRGVCQDFAHLMIGCLRALGLAARYVSGYLLTQPPPGQERLLGADASHAWVAVYCPQRGWVEFDPTNDCLADERYIVLAWGRDFGDVSPLRGVIQGAGEHQLAVSVSVIPDEESGGRRRGGKKTSIDTPVHGGKKE